MDSEPGLEPTELVLDPFSFLPGMASRIAGLGGDKRPDEPNYAFHTPYVEAAPGPCHFTARFTGLTARTGLFQLRVHIISQEPGSHALMANMERIAFNRLVQVGGEFSIRFEGFRGFRYALMGLVLGNSDAQAEDLVVTLDRPKLPDVETGSDGRTTAFGRDTIRPMSVLVSTATPTFTAPVTQFCTKAQIRERAYAEWRQELGGDHPDELARWNDAFVLQALRCYGLLEPGASGLALDVAPGPLTRALQRHGVALTAAQRSGEGMDEASAGEIASTFETSFDPFPEDIVDFDFAFSSGLLTRMETPGHALRLFEESMACLRPGGVMVHTGYLDLDAIAGNAIGREGTLSRGDVERMSLIAISRKHEVAQIKVDRSDALARLVGDREIGAFGIILRRAASIL